MSKFSIYYATIYIYNFLKGPKGKFETKRKHERDSPPVSSLKGMAADQLITNALQHVHYDP